MISARKLLTHAPTTIVLGAGVVAVVIALLVALRLREDSLFDSFALLGVATLVFIILVVMPSFIRTNEDENLPLADATSSSQYALECFRALCDRQFKGLTPLPVFDDLTIGDLPRGGLGWVNLNLGHITANVDPDEPMLPQWSPTTPLAVYRTMSGTCIGLRFEARRQGTISYSFSASRVEVRVIGSVSDSQLSRPETT